MRSERGKAPVGVVAGRVVREKERERLPPSPKSQPSDVDGSDKFLAVGTSRQRVCGKRPGTLD